MGLFTPKYPKSDTPGASSTPAPRQSRSGRRQEQQAQAARASLHQARKDAERASKERSARFWQDYEAVNGKGSVDYS